MALCAIRTVPDTGEQVTVVFGRELRHGKVVRTRGVRFDWEGAVASGMVGGAESLEQENVDWIRGHHSADSQEGLALLAAARLAP
jgi:hypothetical protein